MSFDVAKIAAQKGAGWERVLESARQSLKPSEISYDVLERLAFASRTPENFTAIVRLIYQYGKSHVQGTDVTQLILKYTNDSPFSLSEWVDAIALFYGWLTTNKRKVDFHSMLEYLQCCVASPDAQEGGQTLSCLVEDMLRVHGYDGK